jgi:WW domain-binding protein 11
MGKKTKGGNTKGGKFVNPTDRARKDERRKELKKNKKQRTAVRAAVIKGKDPQQILSDLERLDQMEFNLEEPCPLNQTVLSSKRRKLMETWDRLVKLFLKEDKERYNQIKKMEADYDRKRNELKKQFDAVRSAQNVSLDEIPLPNLPEGPPAPMGLKPPALAVHRIITDRDPPGPPPGPLPDLEEFDDLDEPNSKKLKMGAESDVDAFLREIEEVGVSLPAPSLVPPSLTLITPPMMLRPPVPVAGAAIPPPNLPEFRQGPLATTVQPLIPSFLANHPRNASQPPVKTRQEKGPSVATIEAKPQLRNLTLDSTRFVPTSLRLKRNEKPSKPSSMTRPIRKFFSLSHRLTLIPHYSAEPTPTASASGVDSNKDDAYEQFMKEIQGLI